MKTLEVDEWNGATHATSKPFAECRYLLVQVHQEAVQGLATLLPDGGDVSAVELEGHCSSHLQQMQAYQFGAEFVLAEVKFAHCQFEECVDVGWLDVSGCLTRYIAR